jgi:AraC-like DNA-binding protein
VTLQLAFLLLDGLAVFTILMVGAGILKSAPREKGARLFALIAFNTACFQIWSRHAFSAWIPDAYSIDLGNWKYVLQFFMNATPGLFMVLCFVMFQERERFPRWLIALFAAQMVLDEPLPLALAQLEMSIGSEQVSRMLFEALPACLQLLFVVYALYWIVRDWRTDLVDTRRLLRFIFMLTFGVMTFGLTLLQRLIVPPGTILPFYVHESFNLISVIVNVVVMLILMNTSNLHLSKLVTSAVPALAVPQAAVDRDFVEFERALKDQRLYREPGLTIASLAQKLSIPEYRLRRLINSKLGYRNFNAMLNHYRLEEAAAALADPAQRNTPILTIALTAGYQSINPFNRAFREQKDMTPSEFRRRHLTES